MITFEETDSGALFYSGTIASIAGLIVGAALLCQLCFNYHQLFYKDTSTKQRKTGYHLTIVYLLLAIMICIAHIFFRTNIGTGMDRSSYTSTQCAIGWGIYWYSVLLWGISMSIIFLYRIKVIFRDTIYEYKPYIYNLFYAFISLIVVFYSAYYGWIIYNNQWVVSYPKNVNIFYCQSRSPHQHILLRTVTIFTSTINIALHFALLYMFCKGLISLKQEMMKQIDVHSNKNKKTVPDNSTSIGVIRNELQENGRMTEEAKRIILLHNLIKKTTILVCFAVISAGLYLIWLDLAPFASQQFAFCGIVNTICVWLMCHTSKKYWNCCKTHGVCKWCYQQENELGI